MHKPPCSFYSHVALQLSTYFTLLFDSLDNCCCLSGGWLWVVVRWCDDETVTCHLLSLNTVSTQLSRDQHHDCVTCVTHHIFHDTQSVFYDHTSLFFLFLQWLRPVSDFLSSLFKYQQRKSVLCVGRLYF